MADFLEFLLDAARTYGFNATTLKWVEAGIIALGLLSTAGLGGLIGFGINRLQFRKRTFFDQMVIGVNTFATIDGKCTLQLRTLIEDNLHALMDNKILERLVMKAAKRCDVDNPVLELDDPEDHALLLTKIQNAISRCFARDHLLHMFEAEETVSHWADFVVTCERYGGLKATKIRVLVFVKEDLQRLLDPATYNAITVEARHHDDRLRTLRVIAETPMGGGGFVHGRVAIPIRKLKGPL